MWAPILATSAPNSDRSPRPRPSWSQMTPMGEERLSAPATPNARCVANAITTYVVDWMIKAIANGMHTFAG